MRLQHYLCKDVARWYISEVSLATMSESEDECGRASIESRDESKLKMSTKQIEES